MARRKKQNLIKGTAKHRRTEGDYMSALLDSVTLEDWQDVVSSTLVAAKQGDAQARAWLSQYLVGKPANKAPTPLTVVVQQLNGADPLVEKLAKPFIDESLYPSFDTDLKEQIRASIAVELDEKVTTANNTSSP